MNFLIPFVPSTTINLGSRGFPGFGSILPNDKAERGVMSGVYKVGDKPLCYSITTNSGPGSRVWGGAARARICRYAVAQWLHCL